MKVVSIGRDPNNDVVIDDPLVSRHHLQIIQNENGTIMLEDSGSTNGTYVNGQRISGRVRLFAKDVVKIGDTVLPWRSYFSSAETIVDNNASNNTRYDNNMHRANNAYRPNNGNNYEVPYNQSDERIWDNDGKGSTNSYGLLVFFLGLIALGIDVYLVINFYTSFLNQIVLSLGGPIASLKLFPLYLRGYFGINGKWGLMIAALVLGGVASFIDGVRADDDDKLSTVGTTLAKIACSLSVLFLLLAIFAVQIAVNL